jgi:small subunit ribosomal protein S15e
MHLAFGHYFLDLTPPY